MGKITDNERWKAYWRIIFEVVRWEIRLTKEVTLWDYIRKGDTQRQRIGRKVINLAYEIVGDVELRRDSVRFNGGYLKCYEGVNLKNIVRSIDRGYRLDHLGWSVPYQGENVAIRTMVNIDNAPAREATIFWYPQPGGQYVSLTEQVADTEERRLKWQLSGEIYEPRREFHFASSDTGWHRLRVHQDIDRRDRFDGTRNDYFEFLVDSIPLDTLPGSLEAAPSMHAFDVRPQVFYIGSDRDGENPMFGKVSRLVFDPNDSCPDCSNGN